jgi:hypothetical protein
MLIKQSTLRQIKNAHHEQANETYQWLGEDNEENYQRHLANSTSRKQLEVSGWVDTDITYNFNSHGFRSPEFDPAASHICVFGCSATFGTAIKMEQRYGDILAGDLGVSCYNFGVSGASDSTSFRLAATWLPDLNPKFVIYQTTFPERFEIIENGWGHVLGINAALGGTIAHGQGDLYKIWMTNESNCQLLALKNRLAMKALCHELGYKLIEIDITDFFGNWPTVARDTHHPGVHANMHVAQMIRERL